MEEKKLKKSDINSGSLIFDGNLTVKSDNDFNRI